MVESVTDLWPSDLGGTGVRTPRDILLQQAEALAVRTDHRLRAKVETRAYARSLRVRSGDQTIDFPVEFRHRMVIVVPSLENYELELLNLYHGFEFFPVAARQIKEDVPTLLPDDNSLLSWLREAFASLAARNALSTLLSLAA